MIKLLHPTLVYCAMGLVGSYQLNGQKQENICNITREIISTV